MNLADAFFQRIDRLVAEQKMFQAIHECQCFKEGIEYFSNMLFTAEME